MFILKFNVALKILLVVSIVLQSLTAVVSATPENHQIDIEHLQIQHDHADDRNVSNDNVGDEQHNEKDCHHCGHCSGSHLSWILVSNFYVYIFKKCRFSPVFMYGCEFFSCHLCQTEKYFMAR